MPRRSPAKLRTLLLVVLVFGAVPAVAGVLHSTWRSRAEIHDDVAEETLEEASDTARALGGVLDEARRVLGRLAADPAVRNVDAAACAPLAVDILSMHPDLRNVGAIRSDGTLYCSGKSTQPVGARVDTAVLREVVAAPGLFLREFPAGALAPHPVLACLLPVRERNGDVTGVVFATLDLRSLADLTIGTRLPRGSTVTLVDETGRIVLRDPDRDNWMGHSIAGEPLWSLLREGDAGKSFEAADIDGTLRLFGTAAIRTGLGQPDGFLLIGVPQAGLADRPSSHLRLELAWLGGALVLLFGMAWYGTDAFVLRPVRSIAEAAQEIGAGRLDARSGASGRGAKELAHLGQAFDEMAEALQRSLGDTQSALGLLHDNQGRLSALSRALIASQEAERSQIARELHDEVGQALTAATLDLDALRQTERDEASSRRVQAALDVVKHALDQVRDLSLDLHPAMLDDLGLPAALQWYLTKHADRSGVETQMHAIGLERRLPPALEATCFRIAQEAITNALRHARARRITVTIERAGDEAHLRIRDDGVGFDTDDARRRARRGESLGMLGMEERASLLGGRVDIGAADGGGTEVRAVLPIVPEGSSDPKGERSA
jgi:signal transduction histidine kinase